MTLNAPRSASALLLATIVTALLVTPNLQAGDEAQAWNLAEGQKIELRWEWKHERKFANVNGKQSTKSASTDSRKVTALVEPTTSGNSGGAKITLQSVVWTYQDERFHLELVWNEGSEGSFKVEKLLQDRCAAEMSRIRGQMFNLACCTDYSLNYRPDRSSISGATRRRDLAVAPAGSRSESSIFQPLVLHPALPSGGFTKSGSIRLSPETFGNALGAARIADAPADPDGLDGSVTILKGGLGFALRGGASQKHSAVGAPAKSQLESRLLSVNTTGRMDLDLSFEDGILSKSNHSFSRKTQRSHNVEGSTNLSVSETSKLTMKRLP